MSHEMTSGERGGLWIRGGESARRALNAAPGGDAEHLCV